MSREPIKLRMHHFLCVLGFKGKGYSPEFVDNFWRVVGDLGDNDGATVEAVAGADAICAPCPNNDAGTCRTPRKQLDEPRIRRLDAAYERTLGIRAGDAMEWSEAKRRIAATVTDEAFEENCEPCAWKKLGYCKEALRRLRQSVAVLATAVLLGSAAAADGMANVEQVEIKVLTDKSRRVFPFDKVQKALARGEYAKALVELKALESNVEFGDYFHFLSGQAEFDRMRRAIDQRNFPTAFNAGEKAMRHFSQVPAKNPYTALEKRSETLLGQTEVVLGDLFMRRGGKQGRPKGRAHFENGLQRLSQTGALFLVPTAMVYHYAGQCEKDPTPICNSWEGRLVGYLAEGPQQKRIRARLAALKVPPVEKAASVPYKADLDIQAFQEGFTKYLAGQYDEAYVTWRDLLEKYPRTSIKLRTKFWMGRAAQKTEHDAHAETLYREVIRELPFSFYALLASWFSGIDIARMVDLEIPVVAQNGAQLSPSDIVHVRRAETLIASGAPDLAQYELSLVKARDGMPNEFLVYLVALNRLAGNYMSAFQLFGELSTRGFQGLFSTYGQKVMFPTSQLALVKEGARDHRVDPLLVLSVMKQESAFNPDAISGSNAYGLMQIIAPTARELDPRLEILDLFNPIRNVRLGAKYLAQMLRRYNGNAILALAAYNAGPSAADRWMKAAPDKVPSEEFIELISYRETHDYVQNILRNYFWYSRRLKKESFVHLEALLQTLTKSTTSSTQEASRSQAAIPSPGTRKPAARLGARGAFPRREP